jgi:hypothetical protein
MKKLAVLFSVIFIFSILLFLMGCTGTFGTPVSGNEHLENQSFDYVGFNKLEISHAFVVELTKSDSFSIRINADSNLFEYMDIRKVGDTLYVGLQKNHAYFNTTQRAYITMPDIRGLVASGASMIDINGFSSTNDLRLEASGASQIELIDIKAGDTNIEVSGASRIFGELLMQSGNYEVSGASTLELEGTAENIKADISGASSGKLEAFSIVDADMTISGASNATINLSGRLDANVSGASRLYYMGNPTLGNIDVTGASTFHKKE